MNKRTVKGALMLFAIVCQMFAFSVCAFASTDAGTDEDGGYVAVQPLNIIPGILDDN